MSLKNNLYDFLRKPKIKEEFNHARLKLFATARERNLDEENDIARVDTGELHPKASDAIRSVLVLNRAPITDGIVKRILSECPQPKTVDAADITDAFRRYLIVPDTDFDTAYALFSAAFTAEISETESDAFPVASAMRVTSQDPNDAVGDLEDAQFIYNLCDTGTFRVVGAGIVPGELSPHGNIAHMSVYHARVEAEGTERGVDALGKRVCEVFPSIVRSRSILTQPINLLSQFLSVERVPFVGLEGFPLDHDFYVSCLKTSLIEATKKDSINRRLYNAIHLLSQSDRQSHAAIALSLSCAAMEALVCRKGDDAVGQMLGKNTAVLLEPDGKHRQAAMKYLKRLYQKRSDALHGTRLEEGEQDRLNARCIAAALLFSVLERQKFIQRLGMDPESPDKFFDDLERLSFSAESALPSPELPHIVELWRKDARELIAE